MDGERQLWKLQEEWFARAIGILDLFHALKRLWAAAHCFYAEESSEAAEFVTHHLRLLLEGKVGYVLRHFRQLLRELKGAKKKTLASVITYYENNQQHMRYDEYLSAGYPIASGVIEGACHHFVKDRMEGAGMRWELEGAKRCCPCVRSSSMANGMPFWPIESRKNRHVCMESLHKPRLAA